MSQGKNRVVPVDTTPKRDKDSTTVPPAMLNENKPAIAHNRSHAAHLSSGTIEPHMRPTGDLRQGSYPSGRKQP